MTINSAAVAAAAMAVMAVHGRSSHARGSDDFNRAVSKFTGDDAVFTRALSDLTVAEADEVPTKPQNVEIVETTTGKEALSFDAVASRGTRRLMWHPGWRRVVYEEFAITAESVDLSQLNARGGIPFFQEHSYWWGAQLGKVTSLDVEPGVITARNIRLSRHKDVERYRMDVADGIADGVSLGYKHKRSELIEQENDYPICRVLEILPVELSATSMPADIYTGVIEASVRSAHPNDDVPQAEAFLAVRTAFAGGTTASNKGTTEMTIETTPAPTGADPVIARTDAPIVPQAPIIAPTFDAQTFANRSAELVTIARSAGMEDAVLTAALADPSVTVDAFRSQAFNVMANRQTPGITAGNDITTRGDRVGAMIDAIVIRAVGGEMTGLVREYANHDISDMAYEALVATGATASRHDRDDLFTRTFLTSSDFGVALQAGVRKILATIGGRRLEQLQGPKIGKRQDLPNFQKTTMVDVDNFPAFKKVKEGGEISHGNLTSDGFEVWLQTFARALRITRQAFVNNELNLLNSISEMLGNRIPEFQSDLIFAAIMTEARKVLLGGNSRALLPGVNLLANGTELDADSLDAVVGRMGTRKRSDGTYSGVKPKFLITGFDNRRKAIQLTTSGIVAARQDDVPTDADLIPILDPSIEGKTWFVAGDPASTPAVFYGGRTGNNGPIIHPWQRVPGFDGVEGDVIVDYYAQMASSHAIAGSLDPSIVAA